MKRVCVSLSLILAMGLAPASAQVVQTPLAGSAIPQFIDPLPVLDLTASGTVGIDTLVAGAGEIELHMREFKANVMPTGFVPANGLPYAGTSVFGYISGPEVPEEIRATYTGPVIVATRDLPTQVRYVNDLGVADPTFTDPLASRMYAFVNSTDQTLHWADPLGGEGNMCHHMIQPMSPPEGACAQHYAGPIPAVPHLHGGYVPPTLDGGPDGWFTSDGSHHGHGYYTHPDVPVLGNEQVLRYPNAQEAAPIWFHDHLLGGTRINVYCGLAGAYVITDPSLTLPAGLTPVGLGDELLIPLVIQDRTFDVNGEIILPNAGINPEHPYWVPEFIGDAICVNGKVWPYLDVQPKRYRFLIINGSNARAYELFLVNPVTKTMGPPLWQISTDGGYLDTPVKIDPNAPKGQQTVLALMPGERAGIIIDFAGFGGQNLILRNGARAPYDKGTPPNGMTVGRIMQFRVASGAVADSGYDPATLTALRPPMVRLVDPAAGTLAGGVAPSTARQFTLNEVMGMAVTVGGVTYPGGPLEILVNNTKWSGEQPDGGIRSDFTPIALNGVTLYQSELPLEGTTEVWEIVNLTADTHPMHTHLVQFQLLNRQMFNTNKYNKAYAAAFPGSATLIDPATGLPYAPGVFIPGFGPPLDYNTGNPRALGGNPDITSYLQGMPRPPQPNEAGWKDTVQCPPGMVTRFVMRFAPQDKAIDAPDLYFPFDPFALGYSYVWHCHIVDHEDNEMMRPYSVMPAAGAVRTYVQGVDY
jgi:spore coat protein A